MSYSYENLAIDKSKVNYLQKCFYLINLIKSKSPELWEKYKDQYIQTKPEESWNFYQTLLTEYKNLLDEEAAPKKVTKVKSKGNAKLSLVKPKDKPKKKTSVKKKAPSKKKASVKKKAPSKKKTSVKKKAPAKKKTSPKKKAAKKSVKKK